MTEPDYTQDPRCFGAYVAARTDAERITELAKAVLRLLNVTPQPSHSAMPSHPYFTAQYALQENVPDLARLVDYEQYPRLRGK